MWQIIFSLGWNRSELNTMSHVGFLSSFYRSVDDLQRCAHLCCAVEPWMDEDDNSSDKGKLCKEGISGSVLISFHGEVNWDSERSSNCHRSHSTKHQKCYLNAGLSVSNFCVLSTLWHLGIPEGGGDPSDVADINWLQPTEKTRQGKRQESEENN